MLGKKNLKISFAVLLSGMLLASGCGLSTSVNNEIRDDYLDDEKCVILPENTQTVKDDSKALFKNMTLATENEYLALYFGENYEFALYNKLDGSVRYSNEIYNLDSGEYNKIAESVKKTLQSQVMIEYYSSDMTKFQMSSYPDAKSAIKSQISMETNDDGSVTVKYGLGTNFDQSAVFASLTEETFLSYDARLNEMIASGDLSRIVYRDFVNNYTKIDYSKLSDSEKKSYSDTYPNLPELGIIYIVKPLKVNNVIEKIAEVYNILGVTKEDKIAEAEKIGSLKGKLDFTYFEIPVTYRLEGADFVATCDVSDIYISGKEILTRVYLLPCFAASTMDDEGYIFVPDGSGSIINNDNANCAMSSMELSFFGYDYGLDYSSYSELGIGASLPVFGIKSDDTASFAIVENGAAIGGLKTMIQQTKVGYNIVYPYFDYRTMDDFGLEGVSYAFYENHADTVFAVRYHLMSGKDADYSGMAKYYRQYLLEKGLLADSSDGQQSNVPLDIELIGSIDKTVNYFGIPVDTEYSLTSFDEANKIANSFTKDGANNMTVIYSAMMNGGYYFKNPSKVKISSKLGGENKANSFIEAMNEQNVDVACNVDFIQFFERGNGINSSNDVVQYLKKSSAYLSALNPVSNHRSYSNASYLTNPSLYSKIAKGFIENYKLKTDDLYVASLGSILTGNYDTNVGMTRVTAQNYQEDLLKQLSEKYNLKLDGTNEFALKYASSITNVATTSSHQRMESYSIPFVGMVLKGSVPYTCKSINMEKNPDKSLLEAIESGAGLHFLLMHASQIELQDTDQTDLFSTNYEIWTDYILEKYKEIDSSVGSFYSEKIDRHERVDEDVNLVVYEDGSKIYVNYSDEDYRTKDGTVKALSYLVVGK